MWNRAILYNEKTIWIRIVYSLLLDVRASNWLKDNKIWVVCTLL